MWRIATPLLQTGTRDAAANHQMVSFVPPFLHEHLGASEDASFARKNDRRVVNGVVRGEARDG